MLLIINYLVQVFQTVLHVTNSHRRKMKLPSANTVFHGLVDSTNEWQLSMKINFNYCEKAANPVIILPTV